PRAELPLNHRLWSDDRKNDCFHNLAWLSVIQTHSPMCSYALHALFLTQHLQARRTPEKMSEETMRSRILMWIN
ncbi:uncharacterized, partial [Tachysurus ichikawai]